MEVDELNRLDRDGQYSRFEGEHPPEDVAAFGSRPCTVPQDEALHQCRVLVATLDGLHRVEDRVDRIMTEILETDGIWRAGGSGEGPPRAVFVEVQVYGISASGRDIGQAIDNWVAAARRVVEGRGGDL